MGDVVKCLQMLSLGRKPFVFHQDEFPDSTAEALVLRFRPQVNSHAANASALTMAAGRLLGDYEESRRWQQVLASLALKSYASGSLALMGMGANSPRKSVTTGGY